MYWQKLLTRLFLLLSYGLFLIAGVFGADAQPDSHHGFDAEGLDTYIMGFRLLSNPVAATDAIIQVKTFLNKHLK